LPAKPIIISEEEAIYGVRIAPGDHVLFAGAGISKEAGVLLAPEICDNIMGILTQKGRPAWVDAKLDWKDSTRRYASCLECYGPPIERVEFFRRLLAGVSPSFAHHAIALLMSYEKLHTNAMTTNFDKLIEQAFTVQNMRECQPIRIPEEAEFLGHEPGKCYLFKLHGDYDTHNILNTFEETLFIPEFFGDVALEMLLSRGLLVLGSAGNEESIFSFFNGLLRSNRKMLLARGIRWGVYVGGTKPDDLSDDDSAKLVEKAIATKSINGRIAETLGSLHRKDRPCYLFPVWGSGRFLMRLISSFDDPDLESKAKLFLDQDMRILSLFRGNGISNEVASKHLERLHKQKEKREKRSTSSRRPVRWVTSLSAEHSNATVEILYGDIASEQLLVTDFGRPGRRAVVSADDTMLSAGGGVAMAIASAAGSQFILNEIAKLAPIPHGTVTVTSGGNLPLPYIFHAAALEIDEQGEYLVTADSVKGVVHDALTKARELGIGTLFIPLMGAGLAGLSGTDSLTYILQAFDDRTDLPTGFTVVVVIYNDITLGREDILRVAASIPLGSAAAATGVSRSDAGKGDLSHLTIPKAIMAVLTGARPQPVQVHEIERQMAIRGKKIRGGISVDLTNMKSAGHVLNPTRGYWTVP
jgi:O-acetyl-ADP-ribose deacetylase (regulator of RNase III)